MAEADPLTDLLKASKISDAQRAGLFDVYQVSKNEDDLASRLKSLEIPNDIKASMWDLKAAEKAIPPPEAPQPPSAGTWENRGISGMVWHPASGVSERNRADVQVLGVPPEMAALGVGAVGRAVVAPGLSAAGRVVAGSTAAMGQAAPILKYEAFRHILTAVGVPGPIATGAAMVLAGRGKAGSVASKAAPVAEATAAEATAATQKPSWYTPTEADQALSPLELTRKLKADWQAMMAEKATRETAAAATALQKPKLTVAEMNVGAQLLKSGVNPKQALDSIMKMRELLDTPSFARLPK